MGCRLQRVSNLRIKIAVTLLYRGGGHLMKHPPVLISMTTQSQPRKSKVGAWSKHCSTGVRPSCEASAGRAPAAGHVQCHDAVQHTRISEGAGLFQSKISASKGTRAETRCCVDNDGRARARRAHEYNAILLAVGAAGKTTLMTPATWAATVRLKCSSTSCVAWSLRTRPLALRYSSGGEAAKHALVGISSY